MTLEQEFARLVQKFNKSEDDFINFEQFSELCYGENQSQMGCLDHEITVFNDYFNTFGEVTKIQAKRVQRKESISDSLDTEDYEDSQNEENQAAKESSFFCSVLKVFKTKCQAYF